MDGSRFARWVAGAAGSARRVHAVRFPAQQRLHLAALLIAVALPLQASDISFNPQISQEDFATFSRLIAQGIFPTPVEPAGASGLLRFDAGVAATAVRIDPNATYYTHSVAKDITFSNNYVAVPRLVVSKGLSAATVSASYAKLQNSSGSILGGTLDVPIIGGGLVKPTLALRGSYATLRGVDVYSLNTYGLELFLGKGFGPVTPYASYGKQRSDAKGTVPSVNLALRDRSTITRYGAGVQLNLFVFRVGVEATQAEQRSYAAKVSFGF